VPPNHLRCEVVTHPSLFNSYARPFVIGSHEPNPEYPDQHIALGISTTAVEGSIPISPDDWVVGNLPKQSFIHPRYPTVIAESDVVTTVGALTADIVDEAVLELGQEIGITSR
jgi:mRNA interferase MazF